MAGKTSDFVEFARVLRGKRVTIDTFGVPATPDIVHDLQSTRWGGKTIWDILVDAGVQMTENAGCAACLGGPVDTFGRINKPGIKCISATNRNFPGRMGDKESQVFLASPMTVAASAIAGKIVDPREYLGNCKWFGNEWDCKNQRPPAIDLICRLFSASGRIVFSFTRTTATSRRTFTSSATGATPSSGSTRCAQTALHFHAGGLDSPHGCRI